MKWSREWQEAAGNGPEGNRDLGRPPSAGPACAGLLPGPFHPEVAYFPTCSVWSLGLPHPWGQGEGAALAHQSCCTLRGAPQSPKMGLWLGAERAPPGGQSLP